jgi:hypothetical protein
MDAIIAYFNSILQAAGNSYEAWESPLEFVALPGCPREYPHQLWVTTLLI